MLDLLIKNARVVDGTGAAPRSADVALSVSMTMCSTLGAVIMTPTLTSLLASTYVDVPFWSLLLGTLKVVIVPMLHTMVAQSHPVVSIAVVRTAAASASASTALKTFIEVSGDVP